MRILVVEDDPVIGERLEELLKSEGYAVTRRGLAAEAKAELMGEEYDLGIIDRGLPDGDGAAVVRIIRNEGCPTPILILTAAGEVAARASGLDSGADDYLSKPYASQELMARVRALIRRGVRQPSEPVLWVGKLSVATDKREVSYGGKKIPLSPKEYALLEYLAYHPCQALDRLTLLTHSWDENVDLLSNTVDVHIRYLRKKLGREGSGLIKTVPGKGYMLCAE
jgi:two-component system OmpR family response regulator